jgi:ATP-dependent Clp protease ATP-binding subunit ClpA
MPERERHAPLVDRHLPLSDTSQEAIRRAYEFQTKLDFFRVGSLQLLHGIVRDGSVISVLDEHGVDPVTLRYAIDSNRRSEEWTVRGPVPREITWETVLDDFSGSAKRIMRCANIVATIAELDRVVPESILIGILHETTSPAANILGKLGLHWDNLLQIRT